MRPALPARRRGAGDGTDCHHRRQRGRGGDSPLGCPGAPPRLSPLQKPAAPSSENGTSAAASVSVQDEAPPLGGTRVRATPAIRRRAREAGIDLGSLVGAGGRVTQAILQAAVEARAPTVLSATSAAAAPRRRAHLDLAGGCPPSWRLAPRASPARCSTQTRRAIAERMTRAGAVPQISLTVEARVGGARPAPRPEHPGRGHLVQRHLRRGGRARDP